MAENPSVYIETSVVSYLTSKPSRDVIVLAHQILTVNWWETRLKDVEPFVSPYVLAEAARGDKDAARKRLEAIRDIAVLPVQAETERLAGVYLAEGVIPESEPADALHLALASIHGIDYLLTWNCRHIAAGEVRRRVAQINVREGYSVPILCTPEELMEA